MDRQARTGKTVLVKSREMTGRTERRHGSSRVPAMTYLRDVDHNGVLCTFCNKSALDRDKWCGLSGQSRTKSHPAALGHSPPACSQRAAVLGQLSSLRPHWVEPKQWRSGEERRGKDDKKQNTLAPLALFICV
jgi:hypothetical protein